MGKSQLCAASTPQPDIAKPSLESVSTPNTIKMGNDKRWKKKTSPKQKGAQSTTQGESTTDGLSTPPRRSNRGKRMPATPKKTPPTGSPQLMDIEEEAVGTEEAKIEESMSTSPSSMAESIITGSPNMLGSDDEHLETPIQARTLFSAESISAVAALLDTPSPAKANTLSTDNVDSTATTTSTSTAINKVAVFPYEWRERNDEWLSLAMHAAMNDVSIPGIPSIDHISAKARLEETPKKSPTPTRAYAIKYDLRITVTAGDDPVDALRQAVMLIFAKLQSIDKHAIIYPWSEEDRRQRIPPITNLDEFPTMLSTLRVYAHRLYVRPDGGTCYPQLFFGFMDKPSAIMENIGWWFKSTDQGMWPMTLQNAEDTTCLGWLLYSANEFDREALCREIWQFTGVAVSIRFREIDDGNGRSENREIIKALHLDINKADPLEYKGRLEALYSSSATTFPLGIKMRLVRDLKLLTNIKAKEKARSLRATQGQFLQQTETCIHQSQRESPQSSSNSRTIPPTN